MMINYCLPFVNLFYSPLKLCKMPCHYCHSLVPFVESSGKIEFSPASLRCAFLFLIFSLLQFVTILKFSIYICYILYYW